MASRRRFRRSTGFKWSSAASADRVSGSRRFSSTPALIGGACTWWACLLRMGAPSVHPGRRPDRTEALPQRSSRRPVCQRYRSWHSGSRARPRHQTLLSIGKQPPYRARTRVGAEPRSCDRQAARISTCSPARTRLRRANRAPREFIAALRPAPALIRRVGHSANIAPLPSDRSAPALAGSARPAPPGSNSFWLRA
jgi:hypothetical protein